MDMENPVFETKDNPVVVTRPPKFHRKFEMVGRYSNNVSNAVVYHASKFHETFGILPSVRCKNLAEDLKQMGAEFNIRPDISQANKIRYTWASTLSKKYGLKENLVKQFDTTSTTMAIRLLLEVIIPAYERYEKEFADTIQEGLRRMGREKTYGHFIASSIGTPFVELGIDLFLRINLKATAEGLSKKLGGRESMAFIRYEVTDQNGILIRNLQRSKFEERKPPIAPYDVLELFFLLVAGSTKCKVLFLPTTKMVLEYWKQYDENNKTSHAKKISIDPRRSELRIYDELGRKYGKPVQMLPPSEFVHLLKDRCVHGWRIELKRTFI